MKNRLAPPSRDMLEPIEIASRDEISALQLQRLKWSVQHAYANVAHYRKKCEAQGAHPDDLKTLQDLARFPFTTKDDLRQTYPFGMFARPMHEIVRVHASSGTTGRPTVVGYTRADIDTWAHLVARCIRASGGRPGHKVHVAYGYGLFTGGLGAHYGAERAGCTVIPMSGGQTEKQVQLIRDFEPDIIMITPSYMLVVLDAMQAEGMDPRDCSLKVGIFGAEPWTGALRQTIEASANIDAVDIYGLSEVMGPGVANECIESKDGPHIWEDHFYPEIIDPASGAVLPDGSQGELVFTTLSKEGLPVIRYRTRDLTRLLPGSARAFRRMDKITGRSDDMLIIRGVNVFPTQIEEVMLKDARLSPHYQLEVVREGHLDGLIVHVELRPEVTLDPAGTAEVAHSLSHHIKSLVGISTRVDVRPPHAIPRSAGKAMRVVDNRPKA
jgi:phenylacetate-CoA ligase